ncbi:MAG: hypothetical protein ACRD2L_17830, partial [Terriglobia bacterium]
MSSIGDKFLVEALGKDGAAALHKAAERYPDLGGALLPRAIIAWLSVESRLRDEYANDVPGAEGIRLEFKKSEAGFSGSVMLPGGRYDFENATMFHVAGAVAVALEADVDAAGRVRDTDVERLGKNIDLLAKARALTKELYKGEVLDAIRAHEDNAHKAGKGKQWKDAYQKHRETKGGRESAELATKEVGLELGKIEPPGQTAKPREPSQPAQPAGPQGKAPSAPKPKSAKKPPSLRVMKSETDKKCPVCAEPHIKSGSFVGCSCFKA